MHNRGVLVRHETEDTKYGTSRNYRLRKDNMPPRGRPRGSEQEASRPATRHSVRIRERNRGGVAHDGTITAVDVSPSRNAQGGVDESDSDSELTSMEGTFQCLKVEVSVIILNIDESELPPGGAEGVRETDIEGDRGTLREERGVDAHYVDVNEVRGPGKLSDVQIRKHLLIRKAKMRLQGWRTMRAVELGMEKKRYGISSLG